MRSSMSSDEKLQREHDENDQPNQGPNLVLIYCILGAAMLAAMTVAALIVLPFYRHR
jgi:hypothetical protein